MPRLLSQDQIRDFRAQLCRAAEKLFAEQGYQSLTMRALAAELGCSAMTPYRYFENKQAIFAAVRSAAFLRFGDLIVAAGDGIDAPLERIRAYGDAYLSFARAEPAAYRIMFELAQPSEIDGEMLAADGAHGWLPLLETITEAVDQGLVQGDPLTLAHIGWTILHGLASLDLSDKLMLGRSYEELVEPGLAFFLRGIGAPPTTASSGSA